MSEQKVRDDERMTFGLYQDNDLFWKMRSQGFTDVTAVYAHWTVADGADIGWAFQRADNDQIVLYELVKREPVNYPKGRYILRERTLSQNEFLDRIKPPLFQRGTTYDLKAVLGDYDPAKPYQASCGLLV